MSLNSTFDDGVKKRKKDGWRRHLYIVYSYFEKGCWKKCASANSER